MNETQSYKDLVIDGISYRIQMLPAEQGMKVFTKLLKLVGEPLGELIKVQGDRDKIFEIMPLAIKTLVMKLDENEVLELTKSLCSCVIKAGTSATLDREFNLYFRGKYGHLFKILLEVVSYNYADFLDVLPFVKTEGQKSPQ